jgi:hypothetical protein
MQTTAQSKPVFKTGSKAGIWIGLLAALALHTVVLFVPISKQTPASADINPQIEVQLIKTIQPVPTLPTPLKLPDIVPPVDETDEEPPKQIVETTVEKPRPQAEQGMQNNEAESDYETLSEVRREQLASTILAAQFITEESVTDQIFGKQFGLEISDPQSDFHYPVRQSMIAMLDQPMPEIPFAYTPGLVHFAYAPGVKGDLQRFWDVITPEFGWRTKNGTEFKCIWILIVGGCGWK